MASLEGLAESCGSDVRVVLNQMQMMTKGHKFGGKDQEVMLTPFEACRKLLNASEALRHTFEDRQNMFFVDYSMVGLLVHENYLRAVERKPASLEVLNRCAYSADLMTVGDIFQQRMHTEQEWSLLPHCAVVSCAYPAYVTNGTLGYPGFPAALGKMSSLSKSRRLLMELQTHLRLSSTVSGQEVMTSSYADLLYRRLLEPLKQNNVKEVVGLLDAYGLRREHLVEHLTELRQHLGCQDARKALKRAATKISKARKSSRKSSKTNQHLGHVQASGCKGEGGLDTLYHAEEKSRVRRRLAAVVIAFSVALGIRLGITTLDVSTIESYGTHTLVLLRHGESEWNLENRFTGVECITFERLMHEANLSLDMAFTSYQKRAIKTLNLALEELDALWIPVTKSWKLNERMYGDLQGLNKAETTNKFGEEQVTEWRRSYAVPPPPIKEDSPYHPRLDPKYKDIPKNKLPLAESLALTIDRVLPFFRQSIAPELRKGKKVLIAAHGNSLRALVKILDNVPLVYRLNRQLKPVPLPGHADLISGTYLGDPDWVQGKISGVKNQAKGR
eukprot:s1358_g15.t1